MEVFSWLTLFCFFCLRLSTVFLLSLLRCKREPAYFKLLTFSSKSRKTSAARSQKLRRRNIYEALLKTDASEDNAAESTKKIEEEPIENGTEDAWEDVGEDAGRDAGRDAREDAGENNPPEDDQTARVRGGGRGGSWGRGGRRHDGF
ncbi:hypothetical protein CRE_20059 [Caenorhabditis remanei]|uniref:Uncharacterized protein n=1 Tax=Caenorhabditis remanei TaxID=31234 RepID=E3NHF8_CAERE|nr:hypothetical protein CRE_20059 [Caenorhabditis remanei]